jgi:hypothetical protein
LKKKASRGLLKNASAFFFVATLLQMIQQDNYWMVSDMLRLAEAIRSYRSYGTTYVATIVASAAKIS